MTELVLVSLSDWLHQIFFCFSSLLLTLSCLWTKHCVSPVVCASMATGCNGDKQSHLLEVLLDGSSLSKVSIFGWQSGPSLMQHKKNPPSSNVQWLKDTLRWKNPLLSTIPSLRVFSFRLIRKLKSLYSSCFILCMGVLAHFQYPYCLSCFFYSPMVDLDWSFSAECKLLTRSAEEFSNQHAVGKGFNLKCTLKIQTLLCPHSLTCLYGMGCIFIIYL